MGDVASRMGLITLPEELNLFWFLVTFWSFAAIAIVLGIVISAEEYITEKRYRNDGKD